MSKKIFKGIFLVSFLTLVACLALIMGVLYQYFGDELQTELRNEASFVAQGVEASGEDYFADMPASKARVTWIDASGDVLFDSVADETTMENHSDRQEFIDAKELGVGEATRYSGTLAEKTVYYAMRLSDGTVIRVSTTQSTVWSLLVSMLQPIMIVLAVSIVLSGILASKMAKHIVKPINAIDLDQPDLDHAYEEISPLLLKITRQNQTIQHQMDELSRQRHEFSVITENMNEGLVVIDNMTDVLSYNSAAQRLLGGKITEDAKSVFALNRSETFRRAVDKALSGQHAEELLKTGSMVCRVIANPVRTDGTVTGAVLIVFDVTQAEENEAIRREFTSNVSHELKTPLTSIFGISEMLKNGIVKPEDVKKFGKDINDETGRLITLVNDIIRLSQLDENKFADEKQPVDLYETAKSVIKQLQNYAGDNKVSLELFGEHCKVNGIPTVLDEMVYNLCDNAIKYNKENGSVRISVEETDDAIVLTVKDTGIGIPKEDLNRVFERFYRVDKSHSKKIGGTGLGLSIVKHAAACHDASLQIDSRVDEGTTISVAFPKLK